MFSIWTKHLPEDKREDFQKTIQRSRRTLERLKQIQEVDLKDIDNQETGVKNFDLPNWDYRQAYAAGYKACLKKYIKLVDLDQQKDSQTNE